MIASRRPLLLASAALALLALACAGGRGRRPATVPPPAVPPATATEGAPTVEPVEPLTLARDLLGRPYRYGGATPRGFDCSGFLFYLFERAGLRLPRTASEQARAGRWVPLDQVAPGDLLFFAERDQPPHHVGIVTSADSRSLRMIHASTTEGIVETDVLGSAYWLRRLAFARRVPGAVSR